jgi:pullulanase/glycogen debranching enzyme
MRKIVIFLMMISLFASCKKDTPANEEEETNDPVNTTWQSDLIFYNMRMDMFVNKGDFLDKKTFAGAIDKLDYLADLGITALAIEPIAEGFTPGYDENGYFIDSEDPRNIATEHLWNFFSQRDQRIVDPALGTKEEFQSFVTEAHARGIKVFVEFVFHGAFSGTVIKDESHPDGYESLTGAVIKENPDFFKQNPDGSIYISPEWNSAVFKWEDGDGRNERLANWYHDVLLDWLDTYKLDGFFLDLEPHEVAEKIGYYYWEELITKAKAKGHDIILITEDYAKKPEGAFLFSQGNFRISDPRVSAENEIYDFMVTEPHEDPEWGNYVTPVNIVDVVRDFRRRPNTFYTSTVSCLNSRDYHAKGLVQMAYGAIISPFIPFWFAGEEFQTGLNYEIDNPFMDRLYYSRIRWDKLEENRAFYNDIKKLISIRKEYKHIIAPFRDHLYDTNIAKADTKDITDLPAYIMYARKDGKNQAILVIGTKEKVSSSVNVSFNASEINMKGVTSFTFTNLMTDTKLELSNVENGVDVEGISENGILIYLIEAK